MAEEKKARVEEGLKTLVNDIDRSVLRKMEAQMHYCAAKCCENNEMTVDNVHQCVEKCSIPLVNAQNHVRGELEYFQNRLQRCVVQCHDDIRDKMSPNANDAEVQKSTMAFESCASDCCEKHLKLLGPLAEKIIQSIKKQKQ